MKKTYNELSYKTLVSEWIEKEEHWENLAGTPSTTTWVLLDQQNTWNWFRPTRTLPLLLPHCLWHSFGQWDMGNSLSFQESCFSCVGTVPFLLLSLEWMGGWRRNYSCNIWGNNKDGRSHMVWKAEGKGAWSIDNIQSHLTSLGLSTSETHWVSPVSPDLQVTDTVTCLSYQRKIRGIGYGEHELRRSGSVWSYPACQICQS